MFKTITLITTFTVFGVFSAFAQVQSSSKAASNAAGQGSVSKGPNQMIAAGTIVDAELMNSVDVRKSKVGRPGSFADDKSGEIERQHSYG
jgi:hypothetical protein